jgi:hypothetical protein
MQYIKFDSIKEEGIFKTLNEFDLGMLPDLANYVATAAPVAAATLGSGYLGSKQTKLNTKLYGLVDKGINKVVDKVGGKLGASDSTIDTAKGFLGSNTPKIDFNQIKQPVHDMVRSEVQTQLANKGVTGPATPKITDITPPPPSNNAPKTTASTPTLVSSNTPKK